MSIHVSWREVAPFSDMLRRRFMAEILLLATIFIALVLSFRNMGSVRLNN